MQPHSPPRTNVVLPESSELQGQALSSAAQGSYAEGLPLLGESPDALLAYGTTSAVFGFEQTDAERVAERFEVWRVRAPECGHSKYASEWPDSHAACNAEHGRDDRRRSAKP